MRDPPLDYETVRRALAEGDTRNEVWRGVKTLIYRVVVSILGNQSLDSWDVTHDAFDRVCRGLAGFQPKGEGSFDAWTHQVARNATLAHCKRTKSHARVFSPDDHEAAEMAEYHGPYDMAQMERGHDEKKEQVRLAEAFDRLKPSCAPPCTSATWREVGAGDRGHTRRARRGPDDSRRHRAGFRCGDQEDEDENMSDERNSDQASRTSPPPPSGTRLSVDSLCLKAITAFDESVELPPDLEESLGRSLDDLGRARRSSFNPDMPTPRPVVRTTTAAVRDAGARPARPMRAVAALAVAVAAAAAFGAAHRMGAMDRNHQDQAEGSIEPPKESAHHGAPAASMGAKVWSGGSRPPDGLPASAQPSPQRMGSGEVLEQERPLPDAPAVVEGNEGSRDRRFPGALAGHCDGDASRRHGAARLRPPRLPRGCPRPRPGGAPCLWSGVSEGSLEEETLALKVQALAANGNTVAAAVLGEYFLATYPSSSYVQAIKPLVGLQPSGGSSGEPISCNDAKSARQSFSIVPARAHEGAGNRGAAEPWFLMDAPDAPEQGTPWIVEIEDTESASGGAVRVTATVRGSAGPAPRRAGERLWLVYGVTGNLVDVSPGDEEHDIASPAAAP